MLAAVFPCSTLGLNIGPFDGGVGLPLFNHAWVNKWTNRVDRGIVGLTSHRSFLAHSKLGG